MLTGHVFSIATPCYGISRAVISSNHKFNCPFSMTCHKLLNSSNWSTAIYDCQGLIWILYNNHCNKYCVVVMSQKPTVMV